MKNYLLKVSTVFVMSLLLMAVVNAQDKQVYYLYDPAKTIDSSIMAHPESKIADFITGLGGYEVHMFDTPNLLNCRQGQIDTLESADLIIIGRGLSSGNFGAWGGHPDSIWNLLTTPVLSISMFAIRSATLKWFDGSEDYGGTAEIKKVKVNFPEDPVFAGINMPDDSLEFWEGNWNSLKLNAKVNNGNGTLMATFNSTDPTDSSLRVAYARFSPDVEFYPLSEPLSWTDHKPAGYRTFIGLAADVSGGNPYNYFGYTFDGQDVFAREIERLVGLPRPGVSKLNANTLISARVFPNPAANALTVRMNNLNEVRILDITGKLILSKIAIGNELTVNISNLNAGVYIVNALDSNNNSAVQKFIKK